MPTITEILHDAEHRMQSTFDATAEDFRHIRTGRANPAMLDGINVDYYGTPTPSTRSATSPRPSRA